MTSTADTCRPRTNAASSVAGRPTSIMAAALARRSLSLPIPRRAVEGVVAECHFLDPKRRRFRQRVDEFDVAGEHESWHALSQEAEQVFRGEGRARSADDDDFYVVLGEFSGHRDGGALEDTGVVTDVGLDLE